MLFMDQEIQDNLTSWPFDVVADVDGKPVFSIPLPNTDMVQLYRPEEVSQHVLTVVRQDATLNK